MGNGISLIGTWMQSIAVSWLVYRLTGSPLLLGIAGFCNQIPSFFITPFGGVIADRFNRHRIIVITQTLSMLQAFALAFLMLTNNANVFWIIALSTFLGLVNAFDMPARQSFVNEMVEGKKDLSNAIALNSSLVNSARLIGPSVGGILIATSGEAVCFLINGFSYLAVIYTLLIMKLKPPQQKESKSHVFADLHEGIIYAYKFLPIRYILLLLSYFSLLGMQFSVLMPVFTHQVFHGGPQTLGLLMTAAGGGALVGALYLASAAV
jgi:MFS family permease